VEVEVDLPPRAPRAPISAADLAAFKALGIEVEVEVGSVHVHLVPAYSAEDRLELSIEHAATLRLLLDSFPGARVVRFGRPTPSRNPEVRHVER
jgi:hypothetical protein